jgi:hypothetical protein
MTDDAGRCAPLVHADRADWSHGVALAEPASAGSAARQYRCTTR